MNCFSCSVSGNNSGSSIIGKPNYYYAMRDTVEHNGNQNPEYNRNPDYDDGAQKIEVVGSGLVSNASSISVSNATPVPSVNNNSKPVSVFNRTDLAGRKLQLSPKKKQNPKPGHNKC